MPEALHSAEALDGDSGGSGTAAVAVPGRSSGDEQYLLRCHGLGAADDPAVSEWRSFHRERSGDDPMLDPDWLRGYFDGQIGNLRFYSVYRRGELSGLVPFLKRDWPMPWHLGAWRVAQFPLTRLRLLGSTVNLPENDAAYDLLFKDLARANSGYDAVFLEDLPLDSYLWSYLQRSPLIRRNFLTYSPDPPSSRLLLRFSGSFEDYMGKFSSKHRKNLQREVRKLREGALGEMRFVRYENPDDVGFFLENAFELSSRTYQWTVYQRGLSAKDLIRSRVRFAAEQGWLRSYLLFCGGRVAAFILGFQYKGRYLLHEIGFDPAMAKQSVGTVQLLLMVEDLFEHNRPQILDFESYGKYKEMLSTDKYLQGKMYLFRRGAYGRFLRTGHRMCSSANAAASSVVERFNLKGDLRRRIRGWSSAGDKAPGAGGGAAGENKTS